MRKYEKHTKCYTNWYENTKGDTKRRETDIG
jgi:hypothetical protein